MLRSDVMVNNVISSGNSLKRHCLLSTWQDIWNKTVSPNLFPFLLQHTYMYEFLMSIYWADGITHPSEVTGGLEVDYIILAGVKRCVPVAVVGVVVPHGEGRSLGQAAGWEFSGVVMRRCTTCPSTSPWSLPMGGRSRETLHVTQLPPPHLSGAVLLHHNHMIGAVDEDITVF